MHISYQPSNYAFLVYGDNQGIIEQVNKFKEPGYPHDVLDHDYLILNAILCSIK